MNKSNTKEPIEFFEHTTKIDPNFCDHKFIRLTISRIQCKRCGLGFYDNPFSPFPVEEMNKMIKNEIKERENIKKELDIEKKD